MGYICLICGIYMLFLVCFTKVDSYFINKFIFKFLPAIIGLANILVGLGLLGLLTLNF